MAGNRKARFCASDIRELREKKDLAGLGTAIWKEREFCWLCSIMFSACFIFEEKLFLKGRGNKNWPHPLFKIERIESTDAIVCRYVYLFCFLVFLSCVRVKFNYRLMEIEQFLFCFLTDWKYFFVDFCRKKSYWKTSRNLFQLVLKTDFFPVRKS